MSELHLLRHAVAAPQAAGGGDRERPLEHRGRRDVHALAAWAARHRLAPELVLCSPALRTRQTLDIMAPAFPGAPQIHIEDGLYLASAPQLLARLRKIPADLSRIMLIGHNPGIQELATMLSDASAGPWSARLAAGFPTAALASFEVPVEWPALDRRRARLAGFVSATELMRDIN